jgi:ribosomal protein S27E
MLAKYETDSIKVEMDIPEGGKIVITVEVKDAEVFPPVNWEDKKVRAHLLDLAAHQVMNLLSQKFPAQGDRKPRMIPVVCQGCGKPFEVEQPCCGEKAKRVNCPHCGKPQMLVKGAPKSG